MFETFFQSPRRAAPRQALSATLVALVILLALSAGQAAAQVRDSVFRSYAEYEDFVDRAIMGRQFGDLIATLGGRDEYTPEQLDNVVGGFMRIYPRDFRDSFTFLEEDMGGGMRREARGYRTGDAYVWFYAIMHERNDGEIVVINFRLNSSIGRIIEAF